MGDNMTIKETNLKFTNSMSTRASTKKIVLHHADASSCDAATIHKWHLNNGWAGIGYHFVVRKNGTIERGRPIDKVGAHCTNQNSDSVGVCFEGNFEKETMSDTQIKAGQELMTYLYDKYKLDKSKVKRHKDLMATACPGKNFPFDKIIKGASTTTNSSSTSTTNSTSELYRVRKTWADASSQIGSYSNLDNAKLACKSGYSVFDSKGKIVYTKSNSSSTTSTTTTTKKSIPTVAKPTIQNKSTGTQAKYLQQDLNYLGFKGADGKALTVDGSIGTNSMYAIKQFQKKYSLTVDGIYGQNSYNKMKTLIK